MRLSLFTAALLFSGCMKTYVKIAPDHAASPAADTLVVSARVMTSQETNDSSNGLSIGDIVEVVVDVTANSMLDQFGDDLVDSLTPFLESHGFTPVFDEARAKSLSNTDWGEIGNSLTALTGGWSDPRAATLLVTPTTLFRKKLMLKTAEKLGAEADDRFLYLTVTVHETRHWLIMRSPVIQTTMIVSDSAGEELFRAQGVGEGDRTPFTIDRTPTNLQAGLDDAIAALEAAESKPL